MFRQLPDSLNPEVLRYVLHPISKSKLSALQYIAFSSSSEIWASEHLDTLVVKDIESHTHLGLTLQSNMSWRNRIVKMYKKASKRLNILKCVKNNVDRSTLTFLYKRLIRPIMGYGDVIWNNCHNCDSASWIMRR